MSRENECPCRPQVQFLEPPAGRFGRRTEWLGTGDTSG